MQRSTRPSRHLSRVLSLALVLAPAVLAAVIVYRFGVDVPFWDEWKIAELLTRLHDRSLTMAELFAQHNEHRMAVPRVIQLGAALVAGWDTRVLMWISQVLLLAGLGGCAVLWRRSLERITPSAAAALAVVSLLLYSPAEHQNWLWGFQVCFRFPSTCLLGIVLVAGWPRVGPAGALTAVAVLATVATLSIVPGFLTWPLGAAAVVLIHGRPTAATARAWACWFAGLAVVAGLYFATYVRPPTTPPIMAMVAHPHEWALGTAICIGSPVAFGSQPVVSAAITGAAFLAAFAWALTVVWQRRRDARLIARATPWIVMGSFAVLSAASIALGRTGYGYAALLESRYASMTIWLYIALIMLLKTMHNSPPRTRAIDWCWRAAVTTSVVLYAMSLPRHLEEIADSYRERLQSRGVYLFAGVAPSGMPMVPPWLDWNEIKRQLFEVEREGWRHDLGHDIQWLAADDGCSAGVVEFVSRDDTHLMAAGWAHLTHVNHSADAVVIRGGLPPRVLFLGRPLIGRGDLGTKYGRDALISGWTIDARIGSVGGEPMSFWALDAVGMRGYQLCVHQTN